MKKVTVVPVKEEHIIAIKAINEASMTENYDIVTYLRHIKLFGDINFVALEDDVVVGYILCQIHKGGEHPNRGHVTSIAVLESHRRQKIALKLLLNAVVSMRKKKLSGCSLQVRVSNEVALHLYKDKMQFEVEQLEKDYYGEGADGFFMLLKF